MIKAIVFDMDGLMFDTEKLSTHIWKEVSKKLDINLSLERIMQFKGANKDYKRSLFKQWFGDAVDFDKAQNLRDQLMDEYIDKNGVPVKKGLFELLETMKKKNIKMAVATSTNREKALHYWNVAHITPYIDISVCGDEVSKSKPDPEIFLKSIEKLSFTPAECIVLEDSPKGVEAGFLSGATTIMIPDTIMPTDKEKKYANYIFNSLLDVVNLL